MTDRAEIERLLNKTGRTLDGLQTEDEMFNDPEYSEKIDEYFKARRAVLYEWPHTFGLYQSQMIELLVASLRDALDKVPRWISVEERLPEDRRHVNVIFDDGFRTLGYMQNMKWYVAGALYEQFGIKYWSQLPEPPEGNR